MSELSDRLRDGGAGTSTAVGNGAGSDGSGGAESKGNGAADTTTPARESGTSGGAQDGSRGDTQAEIAVLRHEVTHLSSSLGHERNITRTLESNVAAKDGRIGQLEYLMADQQAENASLERKNAALEQKNAELGQAVQDLTATVRALQAEVSALKEKDARRDQQDAQRDRNIATVMWNDARQDERIETVEARPDDPYIPGKVANKTTDVGAQGENQAGSWHFRRSLFSDPAIAFSTTAIGTAVADMATHLRGMPPDVSIIAPGVFGLGAAGIAWIREIRKGRNGHRSQD